MAEFWLRGPCQSYFVVVAAVLCGKIFTATVKMLTDSTAGHFCTTTYNTTATK